MFQKLYKCRCSLRIESAQQCLIITILFYYINNIEDSEESMIGASENTYLFMWRYLNLQMKGVNKAAFCTSSSSNFWSICSWKWASFHLQPWQLLSLFQMHEMKAKTNPDGGGWMRTFWLRPFIPGKTTHPDQRLRDAISLVLMLIMERSFATQCRPHFPSGQGTLNVCKWVSLEYSQS